MWTALERFGAELLWHVGGAAAHAIRLRAATVRKPKAAVRGVGRGGVELTRRTRRLTQRCGWLPAQISAFMRALPAFLAPLEIGKNGPRTVFAGKPSRVPQPSLPASQERRYTLVTNEDTNTPGGPRVPTAKTTQTIRPGVRSAHHRRRRRHCQQPGRRLLSKRLAARERRRAWDTPAPRVSGPDPAPRPTLVAVEVFGPLAARLDPSSAQPPRG